MAKMSRKLQLALIATERQTKRRQVVGYVLIAVLIVGLLYVCWWVFTHEDSRRRSSGVKSRFPCVRWH